ESALKYLRFEVQRSLDLKRGEKKHPVSRHVFHSLEPLLDMLEMAIEQRDYWHDEYSKLYKEKQDTFGEIKSADHFRTRAFNQRSEDNYQLEILILKDEENVKCTFGRGEGC